MTQQELVSYAKSAGIMLKADGTLYVGTSDKKWLKKFESHRAAVTEALKAEKAKQDEKRQQEEAARAQKQQERINLINAAQAELDLIETSEGQTRVTLKPHSEKWGHYIWVTAEGKEISPERVIVQAKRQVQDRKAGVGYINTEIPEPVIEPVIIPSAQPITENKTFIGVDRPYEIGERFETATLWGIVEKCYWSDDSENENDNPGYVVRIRPPL